MNEPIRRKCFISYYSGDRVEVDAFMSAFGGSFVARAIGVSDGDDFINSDKPDYVMSKIREKYLGDSTVTICLIGSCTHSRRYIDWELKSSLRQGEFEPNGLLAILLPSQGPSAHLPQRLRDNWNSDESTKYALYRKYPSSAQELSQWIEAAFARRTSHAKLIANSVEMFSNNHKCEIHGVTH